MAAIPVIALTGYLGAGKTSLLNHVLRAPGARIGVVINDFGELNVDAGLVTGQVDEPASIAGGCICCLPDDGGLPARSWIFSRILRSESIDNPAPVAQVIDAWRRTAEVLADPERAAVPASPP